VSKRSRQIPDANDDLVKLYYRIGEVSQIVGVQPHVLRYWESEFRTIRPQKSSKGQRVYSRRDVERLLHVKDLLKNQGFTIAGARKQLRTQARGPLSAPLDDTVTGREPAALTASPGVETRSGDRSEPSSRASIEPQALSAPQSVESISVVPPGRSKNQGKALRRALVQLRADIVEMLHELETSDGRPDAQ